MAVTSVSIIAPADAVGMPATIVRPAVQFKWVGGTGSWDWEVTWDDDPTFGNANGNRQTTVGNAVAIPNGDGIGAAPGADLADVTVTWYVRVVVTDTADLGSAQDSHSFAYFDPDAMYRHLYLLGNVSVAFDPTDTPAGGWGEGIGGTAHADGDTTEFNRYLYLLGSVGVGFRFTDQPAGGWGEGIGGNPDGGDGDEVRDFERFLYLLANVDATQPCPFITSLSVSTVKQGESLVVNGQGLVSATSPAVDAYGAEVRLYELPDYGSSYTVLPITSRVAGNTLDTIEVTVPGGATSGFVAVVHTLGATCTGSNFRGLTVVAAQADREAGWWVEAWNLRNNTRVVVPISRVYGAEFEDVANDLGRGALLLPADHPDLPTLYDRGASPPVQTLLKVYLHDRYAFAFFPEDVARTYTGDGAAAARLYGPGKEHLLEWGVLHNYDHPAYPSRTQGWLYGSTEDLLGWGDFTPSSAVANGSFEDASTEGWVAHGSATIFGAYTTEARTGSYSMAVDPTAAGGGASYPVSLQAGQRCFVDVYVKDPTGSGDDFTVQLVDSDGAVLAQQTQALGTTAWTAFNLAVVTPDAETGAVRVLYNDGAGTPHRFWVDDVYVATSYNADLELDRVQPLLSRAYTAAPNLHSLEVPFDAGSDTNPSGFVGIFSVTPGQRYTLQVTVRTVDGVGDTMRVGMRLGGTVVEDVRALAGGDEVITLSATASSTDSVARFAIQSYDADAYTVYILGISVVAGEAAATAGAIVTDALAAVQARGALDMVQLAFDASLDSGGVPWAEPLALELRPEWTMLDLCRKLVGLGYDFALQPNDWLEGGDTGWSLYLWNPGGAGTDWSALPDGPAVIPSPTVASAQPSQAAPLATRVLGEGPAGIWTQVDADAVTQLALEVREEWVRNSEAPDPTTLFRAITHRLESVLGRAATATVQLTEAGEPLPYFDFKPLDTLRAYLPAGADQADWVPDASYRVAAITARLLEDGRQQYTLDLGSYQLHAQRVRDLLLRRVAERLGTENYLPGTGSVSSVGTSSSGGTAASLTGPVAAHTHLPSEVQPNDAGGDLAGTYPNPVVARLRGRGLSTTAPADGQVYVWDAGSQLWVPSTPATPASDLDALTDVDTSTTPPTDGQALVWDDASSLWVPGDVAAGGGGGGALELLAAYEPSAVASLDIDLPAGYAGFRIRTAVEVSGTWPVEVRVQMGAGSVDTGASAYCWARHYYGSATGSGVDAADPHILLAYSGAAAIAPVMIDAEIGAGYADATLPTTITSHHINGEGSNVYGRNHSGIYKTNAAVDVLRLSVSTGTMTGKVYVYGYSTTASGSGGSSARWKELETPVSPIGASFLTDGDAESWSLGAHDPGNGYFAVVNRGALRIGELWPHSGSRYRSTNRAGVVAVGETYIAAVEQIGVANESWVSISVDGGGDQIGIRYHADGTLRPFRWDASASSFASIFDQQCNPASRLVWLGVKRQAYGAWDFFMSLDGDYWTRLTAGSPGHTFTLASGDPTQIVMTCGLESSNYPGQAALHFADVVTGI